MIERLRDEYSADVDLMLLASEMIVDDVVPPERLREELVRRYELARGRPEDASPPKKHGVWPV